MKNILQEITSKSVCQQALILHDKENRAFSKASDIQKEISKVREEKAQMLTYIFQEHLMKDAKNDLLIFERALDEKQQTEIKQLEKRKDQKSKEIDNLALNVSEQIKTLNMMLEDLVDRKEELETSYNAALEYLKAEKQRSVENHRLQLQEEMKERIKTFKNEVTETFN